MTEKFPIHPYCRFKTPVIEERTKFLCDTATEVLYEMAEYCEERKLPFMVTDSVSTADEDKALDRMSDEHYQGRAFDIRISDWLELAVNAFTVYFEKRFMSVAAIGKTSGMPRLIFRHSNGHGDHIHVQVARLYGLKDPLNREVLS